VVEKVAENYVVGLVPEPDLEVRDDLEYVYILSFPDLIGESREHA
jgi:hypothetical protein